MDQKQQIAVKHTINYRLILFLYDDLCPTTSSITAHISFFKSFLFSSTLLSLQFSCPTSLILLIISSFIFFFRFFNDFIICFIFINFLHLFFILFLSVFINFFIIFVIFIYYPLISIVIGQGDEKRGVTYDTL